MFQYYLEKANSRLAYYSEPLSKNSIGFIFSNEEVKTQFNEFIPEIKKDNILHKI